MKRLLAIGVVLAVLTLSGCGTNEDKNSTTANEISGIVEVDLSVPKTAKVGEEVFFIAAVTQDKEVVDDADEVKFEVKNLSSGDKEMIDASLNQDKHYEGRFTFQKKGTYDVTSHVTARDMHTMPKKQITIPGGEE
ncbi:FixH family protein [Paenisporosarcina quisquiliarum]|uniref:FixH family protein n=1 Tax=Paenisporosarcina quisquiliarum TaxID=365346 RepID=UPI00373537EF